MSISLVLENGYLHLVIFSGAFIIWFASQFLSSKKFNSCEHGKTINLFGILHLLFKINNVLIKKSAVCCVLYKSEQNIEWNVML